MKVFISWSNELSKKLAEILREWIPSVIQAVKPYYSPDDITKGSRWSTDISKELEASRVGLICLTRDNLEAPWIMFEAGALSKNLDKSKLCPLLFGIQPTDIKGPLVQFQACPFNKEEFKKVVKMINSELGEGALPDAVFESVYEMWWPLLDKKVQETLNDHQRKVVKPALRTDRDLLEEVLTLTRTSTRVPPPNFHPKAAEDLVSSFVAIVCEAMALGPNKILAKELRNLCRPLDYIVERFVPIEVREKLTEQFNGAKKDVRFLVGDSLPEEKTM